MKEASKPGKAKNIDEYIAAFPEDTQKALQEVRWTIHKAAGDVEETISYAIPAFKQGGSNLIYFAGYKSHVGMYPVPTNSEELNREFSGFKTSGKGAIQFKLTEPMPVSLITKIVKHRLQEHLKKQAAKKKG